MLDLSDFQDEFAAAIVRQETPISPLLVYRNTGLNGLCEALSDNYRVVAELVGEELFAALAQAYAECCPPTHPVLAYYGEGFADWLSAHPVATDISYLVDVAHCERAHVESLFAADARPLVNADLAEVAPDLLPGLCLELHPATRFGWQATPAIDIWLAHVPPLESEIVIDWRATGYLFTRPDLECSARAIDRASHRLLSGIRLGETLGAAAAAANALYPDANIGALFAALVAEGAFLAPDQRI